MKTALTWSWRLSSNRLRDRQRQVTDRRYLRIILIRVYRPSQHS